jgi:hypothetical protein
MYIFFLLYSTSIHLQYTFNYNLSSTHVSWHHKPISLDSQKKLIHLLALIWMEHALGLLWAFLQKVDRLLESRVGQSRVNHKIFFNRRRNVLYFLLTPHCGRLAAAVPRWSPLTPRPPPLWHPRNDVIVSNTRAVPMLKTTYSFYTY